MIKKSSIKMFLFIIFFKSALNNKYIVSESFTNNFYGFAYIGCPKKIETQLNSLTVKNKWAM